MRQEYQLPFFEEIVMIETTGKYVENSNYLEVKARIFTDMEDLLHEDTFLLPRNFYSKRMSELTHYDFAKLKRYISFLSEIEKLEKIYSFSYISIAQCIQSFSQALEADQERVGR